MDGDGVGGAEPDGGVIGRALADFDVLCLQEVANNFADPRLAGSRGENQFAEISRLLGGYQDLRGAPDAVRVAGRRFGHA